MKVEESRTIQMNSRDFGEGCDIIKASESEEPLVYQLTWRERKIYVYNFNTFKVEKEIEMPSGIKEGYGITHDPLTPNIAYVTDSTDKLIYCDISKDFEIIKKVNLTYKNGRPLKLLNELEFVDGHIWGNIWQSNLVVKIDPETGKVVEQWDLSNLVYKARNEFLKFVQGKKGFPMMDVLNGIAYNHEEK